MCYSGRCKYEDYMGDCTIVSKLNTEMVPLDADCVISDLHIEEQKLLSDYYQQIGAEKAPAVDSFEETDIENWF